MSSRSAINYSTRTIKIYASAFDAQARADIDAHVADTNNPHQVDKADVGLGNVDNTADLAKPISALQAEVFALKAPLDSPALTGLPTGPTAPLGTITTQLATAEFVQAAINASPSTDLSDELADHLADTANPHGVTAAQVGLGNVANLAPAALPISDATQIALNAANSNIATVAGELDLHEVDHNNPHLVTAAQVGLGAVDDTADMDKPVSNATQAAINAAVAGVGGGTIASDLADHLADTSNPHAVDAADVGLALVDNVPDASKPVSAAQQAAINIASAAAAAAQGDIDAHAANTSNPHAVDKTDVGLGNVDNIAPADLPVSNPTQAAINAAVAGVGAGTIADDLAAHVADTDNPHAVDANDVGLGSVDNTADLAKPVSPAQQAAINVAAAIGTAAQADIDGHQANVSNPHTVTKAQVGLGSVANLAPAAMPISDATQIALNLKAPILSPALSGLPTAPTAPPLTNSTQLATTAYADAAVNAAFVTIGDPADAIEEAQATADQALADAAEAQATADAALEVSNADIQYRPGDTVVLYGETKAGPQSAVIPIDPTWVTTSPAGAVVRITGTTASDPQVVAPRAALPIEPGRIYSVRWRMQRITDPLDPLNDSVTLGLAWLTNTKAANGQAVVENIPLTIAQGVQERTRRIGLAAGLADFVAPAGTVYFRPYVEAFGVAAAVTDVLDIDVTDITEAVALSLHVPAYVPAPPASGSTVTLTSLAPAFIDNPAVLAALTIRLPPVTTAALMEIGFNRPVTALTVQDSAGALVVDGPVDAYGPGAALIFRFLNPTRRWVYWK